METVQVGASVREVLEFCIRKRKRDLGDRRAWGDLRQKRPDRPGFAHFAPSHIPSQCGILHLNSYHNDHGQGCWPQPGRFVLPPKIAFAAVVIVWRSFGAALANQPDGLRDFWDAIAGLWMPIRVVVLILFLPWMLGLWAGQSARTLWLRRVVLSGLAALAIVTFYPRKAE